MATNPYVNKVEFGDQVIMDLTGDDVTPSDVLLGKTFHDSSGASQTGTYEAPTITNITPSNSSPANMASGGIYKATAAGKAVASVTNLTPSNASPPSIAANTVYKGTAAGYAIASYSSATPSDSSPPSLSSGAFYKTTAAGRLYSTVQPVISTAYVTYKRVYNNNTTTITINKSYRYFLFACLKDDSGNEDADIWLINKGSISKLHTAASGSSKGTASLSGTTLTVKGTNSSRWTCFELVRFATS